VEKIKMVADTTDRFTLKLLRHKWENLSTIGQKRLLRRIGHSDKWVGSPFEQLTEEVKSKIITGKKTIKL